MLRSLKIDSNFIKTIPTWVFTQLTEMQVFNISNNLIQRIPKEIQNWKSNLVNLDLSINRIEELITEVGELNKLSALFLHQNDF